MPLQSAYDRDQPNGSGRRSINDRVIYVFRLYRKRPPISARPAPGSTGILGAIRGAIKVARSFLQGISSGASAIAGQRLEFEFRFPLLTERAEQTTDIRSNPQYTESGYFIDTLPNGLGFRHFRIVGRTFWDTVFVNGLAVDGDAAVKMFAEMIDDYLFPRGGELTSNLALYWLNLSAPVSAEDPFGELEWLIHPTSAVQMFQDSRQPLLRRWQLDFLGLQSNRDLAKAEDGFLAGLGSKTLLGNILAAVESVTGLNLSGLTKTLNEVFETVKDTQRLINDALNVIQTVKDYISGVEQAIKASIALVRGVLDGIETLIASVEQGIELAQGLPGLVASDLRLVRQNFPGLSDGDDAKGVIATQQLRSLRTLMLALLAQPESFAETIPSVFNPTLVQAVSISPGQHIETLAATFDVDPQTLIDLNGLRFPFVDPRERPELRVQRLEDEIERFTKANTSGQLEHLVKPEGHVYVDPEHLPPNRDTVVQPGKYTARLLSLQVQLGSAKQEAEQRPSQPGVLYAGDTLRAPRPSPVASPPSVRNIDAALDLRILALTDEAATEEDRLFGLDWFIDEHKDLIWDTQRNDITLDRGLVHMQNVQVRYVLLPLGGLRFAPGIGNYAYADLASWQTPDKNLLLAYSIWKTLRQDPRVATVRNTRAVTLAGVATVEYDAELINGRTVAQLRVPVGGA